MQKRGRRSQKTILNIDAIKFAFVKIDFQSRYNLKAPQDSFNGPQVVPISLSH
jgi:hypothetical protein